MKPPIDTDRGPILLWPFVDPQRAVAVNGDSQTAGGATGRRATNQEGINTSHDTPITSLTKNSPGYAQHIA